MRTEGGVMESEVQAVLERGRTVRRLPDAVRARALARARAAIVAESRVLTMAAMPVPGRRFRIALAASFAVAVGAAGATAALRTTVFAHDRGGPPPAAVASQPVAATVVPMAAADPEPIAPARASRFTTAQESYRAEVGLLQRAQAAYVNRNFSAALALVAEHGRRFPNGRLAEEREALRVRSLAAAGRRGEARRAANDLRAPVPAQRAAAAAARDRRLRQLAR